MWPFNKLVTCSVWTPPSPDSSWDRPQQPRDPEMDSEDGCICTTHILNSNGWCHYNKGIFFFSLPFTLGITVLRIWGWLGRRNWFLSWKCGFIDVSLDLLHHWHGGACGNGQLYSGAFYIATEALCSWSLLLVFSFPFPKWDELLFWKLYFSCKASGSGSLNEPSLIQMFLKTHPLSSAVA